MFNSNNGLPTSQKNIGSFLGLLYLSFFLLTLTRSSLFVAFKTFLGEQTKEKYAQLKCKLFFLICTHFFSFRFLELHIP